MRSVNQLSEQESRYAFKSPLLFGVLQEMDPEIRHDILDLAPANADTLNYFSQYRCRLLLPGCRDQLLQLGEDAEAAPEPRLFDEYLSWPKNKSVPLDLVLLWDLPNYLDKQTLRGITDYLEPYVTPATVMHIYIHTRQIMPLSPGDYRLGDDQLVHVETASPLSATSPMYHQALLNKLLAPFRIDRGMLLANGLQEYILRARAL